MPVEVGAGGYTLADLWDFPEDGRRRELIDGVLYVSPLARTRHQLVVARMVYLLMGWTESHGGQVFAGVNVDLDDGTHLEPDVALLLPGREVGDVLALTTPPDLVVEVSSPSTRDYDLGVKRDRYARAGAPEFWFADLGADEFLVSRLGTAGYAAPQVVRPGGVLTTPLLPGLAIDVADVLRSGAPGR